MGVRWIKVTVTGCVTVVNFKKNVIWDNVVHYVNWIKILA